MMSEKAKYAPGPWTVIPSEEYSGDDPDLDGSFTCPALIESADGDPVCTFGSEDGSGRLFENEANYHLIAAAPELLEALRTFVYHYPVGTNPLLDDAYRAGCSAIDKAEGAE